MSLEKLLAENLLRFKVKNLNNLEEQDPRSQSVTQSQTSRSKSIYKNPEIQTTKLRLQN